MWNLHSSFCIPKVTEEQPDYENIINRKFLNTQCNCDKNVFVLGFFFSCGATLCNLFHIVSWQLE